jgi:pilus biogenesis lipoprotein CpaD
MRISSSALLVALAALPLAACDPELATKEDLSSTGVGTDNQNYAAQLAKAHRYVHVARGSGVVSEQDRAGLASFIAQQADGRSQAVHVTLTGPLGATEFDQLTRTLVADGIVADKIEYNPNHPVEGQAPTARTGMVVVDVATERWRPVLPTCPDHSQLSILGSDNPDSTNYGCSTATNLSLMVSDPRDLVTGETGGHTDADIAAAAVERLETGKTKALLNESSKSGG